MRVFHKGFLPADQVSLSCVIDESFINALIEKPGVDCFFDIEAESLEDLLLERRQRRPDEQKREVGMLFSVFWDVLVVDDQLKRTRVTRPKQIEKNSKGNVPRNSHFGAVSQPGVIEFQPNSRLFGVSREQVKCLPNFIKKQVNIGEPVDCQDHRGRRRVVGVRHGQFEENWDH